MSDLSPLATLKRLRTLDVSSNAISDLAPLLALPQLRSLNVSSNPLDVAGLAELSSLQSLHAADLGITDLAFLSQLTDLRSLDVSNNPLADLSVLRELTKLSTLSVRNTNVDDLSPLSGLDLWSLNVGGTRVSLDDVLALPNLRNLGELYMGSLGLESEDLGALMGFHQLVRLGLANNRISDVSPLATLRGLRSLDIRGNVISDIGPLVRRDIWDLEHRYLHLYAWRNPLNHTSVHEHVATLESWGITVSAPDAPALAFTDPILRRLVSQAIAGGTVYVDSVVDEETIRRLRRLDAFNAGVSDLTGLEAAVELREVFLGSNAVSDLTPLADLPELAVLDLTDNRISDLSPLVANPAVGAGDSIVLDGNPMSEESLNAHVPALLSRGARVGLESVRLRAPLDGGTVSYRVSGYFAARVGTDAGLEATSGDPDIAAAAVAGGRLRLTPGALAGTTTVTVTASGTEGRATLTFAVSFVERPRALAAVPTVALGGAGDAVEFSLADLFAGDGALTFVARSSAPSVVVAEVVAGVLTIRSLADPGDEGVVAVTVTATDIGGLTGTLTFDVAVAAGSGALAQRGWLRGWLELQRPQAEDAGG